MFPVGHRHGIPMDPSGIYEAFCGKGEGLFDVTGPNGRLITNSMVANMSPRHRTSMFTSFFNMQVVEDACKKHGLKFAQR